MRSSDKRWEQDEQVERLAHKAMEKTELVSKEILERQNILDFLLEVQNRMERQTLQEVHRYIYGVYSDERKHDASGLLCSYAFGLLNETGG